MKVNIHSFLNRLFKDTRGGSAIEFGLICAMIIIAMLGALKGFTSETISMWNNVASKMQESTSSVP